jgi:PAS domain S-box-containing protein
MISKKINIFSEKGLVVFIYAIIIIIVGSTINGFLYRNTTNKNLIISRQIIEINQRLSRMNQDVNLADLGLRGFMINGKESMLSPFFIGLKDYNTNFKRMGELLDSLGFDVRLMAPAKESVHNYMKLVREMVDMLKNGDHDAAREILDKDHGLEAWKIYSVFEAKARGYLDEIQQRSTKEFNKVNRILIISQLILFFFGIPILIVIVQILKKARRNRKQLFARLEESNDQYVFNDGKATDAENEELIIEQLIDNLKRASAFIKEIAKGNYEFKWEGMRDDIKDLNTDNIAGELINMRDQMKEIKTQDEIRIWETEGLANFAGIVRKYQHNVKSLSENLVTELEKYLKVQVGAMFIVNKEDTGNVFLELKATYAFDRLKYIEKKIEPGQGLAGQCYQEGLYVYMRDVPESFVTIKSALGDAPPTSVLIVPLKTNGNIAGVLELASFKEFTQDEIDFLHKLGETIASAIHSVRTNEQTRELLEKSQQQAEEMRAQDEEMRQNMEELQATQEQMERKNKEIEDLLRQASENEERLKIQLEAIEELQQEQEQANEEMATNSEEYKQMMMEILNEIPEKVYLKDAEGHMFLANQRVADAHGLPLAELIGKSDFDFVDEETAREWREQELKIMEKGAERYVFEEVLDGKRTVLDTVKKTFYIHSLKQYGLLGVQRDITELYDLKKEVEEMNKRKK